ncbi:biosynthetic-type acetolactate synthase large subunit [Polynucleobacter sp. HIN8]|uniref:thiamine pyrophosphate-binding protein n=1 Tax=Polynucleobacter sp. HIN8 TaxID=3047867 RepID=UPI002572302C|nr:thiamine pyrophosphate-binding protein [Polynucleobacter sp. HIN8]BEI38360.1 biosynthetic-type acetolactate synthase large subunit [Polynucleobacter sp. HIN8]
MKLSDYVADFIKNQGTTTTFVLTGGCIVHLIDSIGQHKDLVYIPMMHEQSCAMAADAYARITGKVGVALVTSGPGATNLLTGVCCSYYDSVPVLFITGQVPSSQLKRGSKSRQIGFQETDVVSIFEPVTKYSKLIEDPLDIRFELEKAFYLAREGRPGPVLLDICDDIQRADINPEMLRGYMPPKLLGEDHQLLNNQIQLIIEMLKQADRPLLVLGAGIRTAGIINETRKLIDALKIPFTLTWGAMDICSHDHELFVGGFGVTSGRPGNFAIQNADLIIAMGTRFDSHEAGPNLKHFARGAKKVIVDLDFAEQEKYSQMGMKVDLLVTRDVRDIVRNLLDRNLPSINDSIEIWKKWISKWKKTYPICLDEYREQSELINPYVFMEKISEIVNDEEIIVTDCGSNLIWTMQGFKLKGTQRLISAFNHSPMGYSLPASIGAALANPDRQIICIIGDGGLQINIQELATIDLHKLNIKIFVLNNHGHGIIQGTQDNWLGGRYFASNPQDGLLPDPDCKKIAIAYGIKALEISNTDDLKKIIIETLNSNGPVLCNVHMLPGSQIAPKLLYGRPLEDSSPLLSREEFHSNMLIPPIT